MRMISSRSSAASRSHYWRTALAGTVTLAAALVAASPAASAAGAATPVRAASVSATQIGGRSAAHISGAVLDIQTKGCYARVWGNWVHIYRLNPGTDICVGFTGTISLAASNTYEFCAGNNYGNFKYHYSGRPTTTQNFKPGYQTGFSAAATITQVTITGWSGSFQCPA